MKLPDLLELYCDHLRWLINSENDERINPRSIKMMLKYSDRGFGVVYDPTDETEVWIWSDLHLYHKNIIKYCERPFSDVGDMNGALFRAWKTTVGYNDHIICGGDIALAGSLGPDRLGQIKSMPGTKLTVLGNHDFSNKTGHPADTGCEHHCLTMVIDGDPPLLLTHLPLWNVPDGCVNLHGHVHNNEPLRKGPYINICVEHLEYKPHRMDVIRNLAKALLSGHVGQGKTTAEWLREI